MRSICHPDPVDFVHPVEAVIPGVQGRVLAVLVETTAELNLRTLARLAGVSVAQASRVQPESVIVFGSAASSPATRHFGATLHNTGSSCTVGRSTNSARCCMPKPMRTRPVTGAQVRAYADRAQYEPDDIAASVAEKSVERAERCVEVARSVAGSVK